ncbi:glycosyltransferase family 2 protein [Actinoplanes sp. NPDC020271]|uniref:glycosyltransferase family 2 protein n=1 Tax=Actinoplanes sp. NPDC020271 TaxID=3363896 RepID=UPI003794335A
MNATATLERLVPTATPAVAAPVTGPTLWAPATTGVELTVVVPFYNCGPVVGQTIHAISATLAAAGIGHEIIAVNDGSTDGSQLHVPYLPQVRLIDNRLNSGKGNALHQGFAAAQGAWVGFIDADGDIDPAHLATYLELARGGDHAAVYADKRHAHSVSGASKARKLISMVYSTLVTLLFLLQVKDTQTGCKIIRRDALAQLLPHLREQRFAFDLEFFVAAKAAGIRNLHAAPVALNTAANGSTVTSKTIVRTLRDTVTILGRHLGGHYRQAAV